MLAAALIVNAAATLLRASALDLQVLTDGEWPLAVDGLPAVMVEARTETWSPASIHSPDEVEAGLELRLQVEAAGDTSRADASTWARRCLQALLDPLEQDTAYPWPSFAWTGEVTLERSFATGTERLVSTETITLRCSYLLRTDQPGQPL